MKLNLGAACWLLVLVVAEAGPAQPAATTKKVETSKSVSKASAPVAKPVEASAKQSAAVPQKDAAIAATPAPHRARLDVGFASFEKTMLEHVVAKMQAASANAHWTSQVQAACKDNVTKSLSQGLKSQLAALKQSIGKTWMALPEDDQKNAYVEQLKSAYEPVFSDAVSTIDSHLNRTLSHVYLRYSHKKEVSQDELVSQCETSINANILDERCYDIAGQQHLKKVSSFLEIKGASPKKFCMPSLFEAMVRRLHDSQGLIGMTMQFESKSLSLSAPPAAIDNLVKQVSAVSH